MLKVPEFDLPGEDYFVEEWADTVLRHGGSSQEVQQFLNSADALFAERLQEYGDHCEAATNTGLTNLRNIFWRHRHDAEILTETAEDLRQRLIAPEPNRPM
jgi:hypothetical protein